jgi:outer membrane biosynthesis protein TonB
LLKNPASPEFGPGRAVATAAIAAALLLHAALVWLLLQEAVVLPRPRPPIAVTLVRPPPAPPPPVPQKKDATAPVITKPIPHAPIPIAHPSPQIHVQHTGAPKRQAPRPAKAPLVPHFNTAPSDDGLGLDLNTPSAGTGQGSMGDFDDGVKQRIEAHKTYPPAIKGMWNQCVVSYRVTVDQHGQLVNYKLFGCGNPFLDAAARAAILLASPFPVPPDFGGSRYDVYGSLIFKQK